MSLEGHFPDHVLKDGKVVPVVPREVQRDILRQVDLSKRFVVVEAPTGVGKTLVAMAVAKALGNNAFVCTVTRMLQDQYVGQFSDVGATKLEGAANFDCQRNRAGKKAVKCSDGRVIYRDNPCGLPRSGCQCPYADAKKVAMGAPLVICNYASYVYNCVMVEKPQHRPLLVCDEAHALERFLMDHVSLPFRDLPVHMDALDPRAEQEEIKEWVTELQGRLLAKLREYEQRIDRGEAELASDYQDVEHRLDKIGYYLRHQDVRWYIESEDDEHPDRLALKPLTVRPFGEELLFCRADQVLLMSATILNHETFCRSLGIDLGDTCFVRAPCVFPVEHRRVYADTIDMRMTAREKSWPAAWKAVDEICRHHGKVKGLVLASSNKMIEGDDRLPGIVESLSPETRARLVVAYGRTRESGYRQHLESAEPTILIGSNLWEGIDLEGALCRFVIIPALPLPPWRGMNMARAKAGPSLGEHRWYDLQGYLKLIQGLGRGVRNEEDVCLSYVLDARFASESMQRFGLLPDWLREAVVVSRAPAAQAGVPA